MTSTFDDPEDGRLQGARVLVVEDEVAIALLLEDMLIEFGCEVVGTASRVAAACEIARSTPIDVVLLDFNVAGDTCQPVVEILDGRNVPIVVCTGYGGSLGPLFDGRTRLEKPFTQRALARSLAAALGRDAAAP